jgi:hypothetical protein
MWPAVLPVRKPQGKQSICDDNPMQDKNDNTRRSLSSLSLFLLERIILTLSRSRPINADTQAKSPSNAKSATSASHSGATSAPTKSPTCRQNHLPVYSTPVERSLLNLVTSR